MQELSTVQCARKRLRTSGILPVELDRVGNREHENCQEDRLLKHRSSFDDPTSMGDSKAPVYGRHGDDQEQEEEGGCGVWHDIEGGEGFEG